MKTMFKPFKPVIWALNRTQELRSSLTFVVTAMSLATFTDIYLYSTIVPVVPFSFTTRYGIPADEVQKWISVALAVYSAGLIVGAIFFGFLTDKLKQRKTLMMSGLLILLAATFMLCFAKSISVYVVGRLLQGISGGLVWTVGLAIISDIAPPEQLGFLMSFPSISVSLGVVLGPLIGGVVYEKAGYYAVYYVCFVILSVDIVLRLLMVEKSRAVLDNEARARAVARGNQIHAGNDESDENAENSENSENSEITENTGNSEKTQNARSSPNARSSNAQSIGSRTPRSRISSEADYDIEASTAYEHHEKDQKDQKDHDNLIENLNETDTENTENTTTTSSSPISAALGDNPSGLEQEMSYKTDTLTSLKDERKKNRICSKIPASVKLLWNVRFAMALLQTLVLAWLMTALDATLSLHLKDIFGFNSLKSGCVFLAIAGVSLIEPLIGKMVDRYGIKWPLITGFVVMCPGFILLRIPKHYTVKDVALFIFFIILCGFGMAFIQTPALAELTIVVAEEEAKDPGCMGPGKGFGQAYALFNVAFALGSLIGPFHSGGIRSQFGWARETLSLGLISIIMAVLSYYFAGENLFYKDYQYFKRKFRTGKGRAPEGEDRSHMNNGVNV